MSADSATESVVGAVVRPGLIWGLDFIDGGTRPVDDIALLQERERPDGFRWLHLNLSDQRTQRWIASSSPLPPHIRELLLSADVHQRTVIEDGVVGFVLQDIERDFDDGETRVGLVHFAVAPTLMITARFHPLRSADVVKHRITSGAHVSDPGAALELMLGAMFEVLRRIVDEMDDTVQAVEDELLKDGRAPETRAFIIMRSLMVKLHRLLSGARAVLHRLDDDDHLPSILAPTVLKAVHRLAALDAELLSIQSQLRLLRDELDLQATQKTNQNLYILSMMSALMLPATLVTGLFGMNTGGMLWAMAPHGTLYATLLAGGSALGVYVVLRMMGFIRR